MNDPSLNQFYFHPSNPITVDQNTSRNFELLNGVNNFSVSKSISIEQQNLLGSSNMFSIPNAACELTVSFDRSYLCKDPLFFLTGSDPLRHSFIKYNLDVLWFNNLYLTSYSAGFSVGELPIINTKFITYESNIANSSLNSSLFNTNYFTYNPVILDSEIPTLGSISITGTCRDKLLLYNNIFSFDYSLDIKRQPYYSIGSRNPQNVKFIPPIVINFSVNSKISSYRDDQNFWPRYIEGDISLKDNYYDFDIMVTGTNVGMTYPIKCAKFISSEIQSSSTTTAEVKRNFIGYYGI